jgi:hypothetical protein
MEDCRDCMEYDGDSWVAEEEASLTWSEFVSLDMW